MTMLICVILVLNLIRCCQGCYHGYSCCSSVMIMAMAALFSCL